MKRPEQALQRAVARYLELALPREAWFTAFPAGGGGKVRGAILKGMGLKPGVPDLLILHHGELYGIELKASGGRLSPEQGECHRSMARAGCQGIAVCKSVDDVAVVLREWRILGGKPGPLGGEARATA